MLQEINNQRGQCQHFCRQKQRPSPIEVILLDKKFTNVNVASTERIVHVASEA